MRLLPRALPPCALIVAGALVSSVSLPLTAQESQTQRDGPGPYSLGDSQADLLYTPLTPCRIVDTRLTGAGPIGAGTTRSFSVTGTDLSAQGGSATGCGVPSGATAAAINFVAVNAAGPGDLRVTPFGTPMPLASIINYAAVTGLNLANGPVIALCNPATTTCTSDITVQADASAVDLVADVQGYFRSIDTEPLPRGGAQDVTVPAAGMTPVLITGVSFTPKSFGSVLVRARGYCHIGAGGPSTDDEIELGIGANPVDAFNVASDRVGQRGDLRIPMNSGVHRLMFSTERIWPTARGATYFLGLFARHALGSDADTCSGTLVVERHF